MNYLNPFNNVFQGGGMGSAGFGDLASGGYMGGGQLPAMGGQNPMAMTQAPMSNQPVSAPQPAQAAQPATPAQPVQSPLPSNIQPTNMAGNPFQFTDQRQADAFGRFMTSPDYQFRMNEGRRALDSSAAARGMLLSGNQLKELTQFGQGLAAGEYGNYYNRMAGIAGMSQPTDFGGFAGMGANTLAQGSQQQGQATANLANIQGANANAQGAIWGNVFGQIPWGQVGNAVGGMFGGQQAPAGGGFNFQYGQANSPRLF